MKNPAEEFQTNAAARCAVIISHHNYSQFVRSAIEGVLSQTHANLECIVVDDASEKTHRDKLREIVKNFGDKRLQLVELKKNRGQIPAFFEGLQATSAEFVGFLDPDDIYEPNFLESLVRAHLNPTTTAALASCEMGRYKVGGGPLTRSYTGFRGRALEQNKLNEYNARMNALGFSCYYPPWQTGWLWSTTSGMLFRNDVLKLLEPVDYPKDLSLALKTSGDVYLACGAHMLGGSLFVDELLSWRGVHALNTVHPEFVFSQFQAPLRESFKSQAAQIKGLAVKSFLAHGAKAFLSVAHLGEVLTNHFDSKTLFQWISENPTVRDLLERFAANATWDEVS